MLFSFLFCKYHIDGCVVYPPKKSRFITGNILDIKHLYIVSDYYFHNEKKESLNVKENVDKILLVKRENSHLNKFD